MMINKNFYFHPPLSWILILFPLISCQRPAKEWIRAEIQWQEFPSYQGGQPYLGVDKNQLWCSWLEYSGADSVQFLRSTWTAEKWSKPEVIAGGSDWFVNWADFPSLLFSHGWGLAHWLQYRDTGTFDYDVRLSIWNGGWQTSFVPHRDSIAAEHGFASIIALDSMHKMVFWLDGRKTKSTLAQSSHDGHGHGGPMTLRSCVLDRYGNLTEEVELDSMVCDCCQTDATLADSGPIVVYRDRTQDEVRDIYISRKVDGQWLDPTPVFRDNWKIGGCPVNGPSVVSDGLNMAVAWYTEGDGEPVVKLALSSDAGKSFDSPLILNSGEVLGRIDMIVLNQGKILVSWLEKSEEEATLVCRFLDHNGQLSAAIPLLETSMKRQSGFPRICKSGEDIFVAHTHLEGENSRVRTGKILFQ